MPVPIQPTRVLVGLTGSVDTTVAIERRRRRRVTSEETERE